jgi:hypothetical protein
MVALHFGGSFLHLGWLLGLRLQALSYLQCNAAIGMPAAGEKDRAIDFAPK